jgi:carboxyl-terminal processing protease
MPHRATRLRRAVVLVAAAVAPGVATPASAQSARSVDASAAVATFDSAWSIIHRRHFDTTFGGIDWLALRDTLRPRATAAADVEQLRGVIRDMISRLRLSHYALLPAEAASTVATRRDPAAGARPGNVGLDVRLVDGAIVVRGVAAGSAAARAGVRTGWIVTRVDTTDVASFAARRPRALDERKFSFQAPQVVHAMLMGAPGSRVRVTFRDARDRTVTHALERAAVPGTPITFGHLPTMYAETVRGDTTAGGARVGMIRFNVWMTAVVPPVDSAIDAFRDADGIVFDLRGNPGGVAGIVMGVAGHLIDTTVALGVMRSRESTLRFRANPRRVNARGQRVRPFAGAVAILVDEMSASTTEFFAAGLQEVGRARIFGARTSGQALPAQLTSLPNGDVLYHAVADFTTPKGVRMEKDGVAPDEPTPLTRRDLLAGRDAQLEAALTWIARQPRAARPSTSAQPSGH